ncbi:MAG: hypothetical protein CSB44_01900 [Gammaproteobacteria bacterium]|nr:MAG: hypothetical protein CSB44_01900 [Gammaproteobacteria bacterium]
MGAIEGSESHLEAVKMLADIGGVMAKGGGEAVDDALSCVVGGVMWNGDFGRSGRLAVELHRL